MPTAHRHRSRLLAPAVAVALLWASTTAGAAADPTASVPEPLGHHPNVHAQRYERPVPGEVVRPFQAPGSLFGAGHRGVDLAAAPGAVVRAAADGIVSFAGSVAGTIWVSIHHYDNVVTSYGPLARREVSFDEDVRRGEVVGVLATGGHGHLGADHGLHWGARRNGVYFDPMTLLDEQLSRASLLGIGSWEGTHHHVVPYEPWDGGRLGGLTVGSSPVADRQGFAVPPNPNHLVLLQGFGSDSDGQVLDADHLGYDPRSVTYFSYAGRHDEGGEADDPRRDQLPYGSSDTWEGIDQAARRLAEQLRAQAAREPGRAVDLVAHSLGGVVVLHYLLHYHDPYDRSLPPIGNIVTIASPLRGTDMASIGRNVRDTPLLGPLVNYLQQRQAGPSESRHGPGVLEPFVDYLLQQFSHSGQRTPLTAPTIDQLAVGSPQLRDLATAWEDALARGTAGPLGMGTRVMNIGASRDFVVPTDRTRQPSGGRTAFIDGEQVADHRVLPGGHSGVLETEALREVVWRFLAGDEVVDSPGYLPRYAGGAVANDLRIRTGGRRPARERVR